MNNKLLLESRNDIPFPEARVSIHQPTIKEISLIGEESFWSGCQFLIFSLKDLEQKDKSLLEDKTDFEIFMSIMSGKEKLIYKNHAKMVLTLLFPDYEMSYLEDRLELRRINDKHISAINANNFDLFKDIVSSMFDLDEEESNQKYNPADARAAKIAEKFKKREQKKAKKQTDINNFDILKRFISTLAVGEQKDKNELMNYTVYQLKDEYKTFQKKEEYDLFIKAKMAGAQDLEDVDNWMNL